MNGIEIANIMFYSLNSLITNVSQRRLIIYFEESCGIGGAVCKNSTEFDNLQSAKSQLTTVEGKKPEVYQLQANLYMYITC